MADVTGGEEIDKILNRRGCLISTRESKGTCHAGHSHGGLEFQLVHSGLVGHRVGTREFTLTPGEALLFRSEVRHVTRPDGGTYYRSVMAFVPDILPARQSAAIGANLHVEGDARHVRILPKVMTRVLWALNELNRLGAEPAPPPSDVVGHLVGLILCDINWSPTAGECEDYGALCAAIIDYMKANLYRCESNADLGARFYLSESRVRQIFHKRVSCSPQAYWLRLKMEAACEHLTSGTSVKETAAAFGFDTISGFRRAFQRVNGLTPSQYQEMCARKPCS